MRSSRGVGVSAVVLLLLAATVPHRSIAMVEPAPTEFGQPATPALAAPTQLVATDDQWTTLELSWAGGTTNPEPQGWRDVGFDDSAWSPAYIPDDPYPNWADIAGAEWLSSTGRATGHLTSEIWIARRQFQLTGAPDGDGVLTWNVDNYASIWINGQALVTTAGHWTTTFTTVIPEAVLQSGTNVIAVQVFQDANTNTWEVNPTMFQARLEASVRALSCADEDRDAQIAPTDPADRVTVEYDPGFLVDPGRPDFEADAELIAGFIKRRAEEGLDHYEGLGMATPAAVTIEIKCQLEYFIRTIDAPGFTGGGDLVQLRASNLEGWFAQDVKNDFPAQGAVWNAPGAEWRGLVDHEMFHVVQWASSATSSTMGLDRRWNNGDHAWTESPAVLAQDLFAETDDLDPLPGSYLDQLGQFAANARVPLDIPVHDMDDAPQYWFAGALQYWAERFGPQGEPNLESRAARFLDALARGTCCHTSEVIDFGRVITYDWEAGRYGPQAGAYGRAISALRDYYVAHFALRATNVSASEQSRYAILDAETGHGLAPGVEPGGGVGQYPELEQIRGELDLTAGPDTIADDLPAAQGEVYLIPVPAATVDVELDISAADVDDATADSAMRIAFVPVGADGSVVVDGALMPSAPRPGQTLTRTVGMTGRTALALVLVGRRPPGAVYRQSPVGIGTGGNRHRRAHRG